MQILAPPTDPQHAMPAGLTQPARRPPAPRGWHLAQALLLAALLALLGACDVSAQAQTLPTPPVAQDLPDVGVPSVQPPGMPATDAGSSTPVLPDITLPDVRLPDISTPEYDLRPQSPRLPGAPGAAATPEASPGHSQESESSDETREATPEDLPAPTYPAPPSSSPNRGSGTNKPPSYIIQRRPKWASGTKERASDGWNRASIST